MEPQGKRHWWDFTGGGPKLKKYDSQWNTRGTKVLLSLWNQLKNSCFSRNFDLSFAFKFPGFDRHFQCLWMTLNWQWLYYFAYSSSAPQFNPIKLLSRGCWRSQRCSISPPWSSRFQTASFMRKHVIRCCNDSVCHFSPHFSHLQYPPLLMQDRIIRSLISTHVRHAV